jgi:TonB family protein
MRRRIAIALVALSVVVVFQSFSLAQQQPEGTRKIVNRVIPVYPDIARKMQLSGTVRVEVVVAPDGKPKSTRPIGGSPLLVRAAVDAVGQWKWAAASQETKELVELSFHPR